MSFKSLIKEKSGRLEEEKCQFEESLNKVVSGEDRSESTIRLLNNKYKNCENFRESLKKEEVSDLTYTAYSLAQSLASSIRSAEAVASVVGNSVLSDLLSPIYIQIRNLKSLLDHISAKGITSESDKDNFKGATEIVVSVETRYNQLRGIGLKRVTVEETNPQYRPHKK